ncbi:sigma 54-interacting transcriptional regulator [Sedimentibacter sp. zth1]|uniref:sigma-54-dependent Fis family transcriptional regulator n=1 Tax=Sedimentibacter sp. zth1 TaxID=2816908 RepID=UPI001A91EA76|nr:sigma 54-interacting transcriptional regulator [Sedimentibacter sp. zth1]QSX04767.1 sigma 54-interacting transcriptional regulator [Sedimentibacter sp. zth1]
MKLTNIQDNVQKNADAIASVLGVDVTVTDNNLFRIAGTGKYNNHIGEQVTNDGVFAHCLVNCVPYVVRNPKEDKVCKSCSKKNCDEYAEIVSPIIYDKRVYGIIGLIAFNEEQKRVLLGNEKNIIAFLNKMANLIVSQIIDKEKSNEIKLLISQLQTVINLMDSSVIITDSRGNINYYNKKANNLFHISSYNHKHIDKILLNVDIDSVFKYKKKFTNKDFSYKNNDLYLRGIINSKIYYSDANKNIESVVFFIEELSQFISSARNIISTNIVTEFDNIKYVSEKMQNVVNHAKKASRTDSTVLITGESGTGKEVFARALHYDSNRKKEPFVAINCSAIPENLFESELFGYEEGAYTGALKGGHPGKFELAHKGTLLLDEIGDMPLNLQPKLLRVLQDSKVMRIGGNRYIDVDVRIIASTNCNLEKKVQNKEFREDLFYRLNVIPILLPPLRDRPEDITLLANFFTNKYSSKLNKSVMRINEDALDLIKKYPWYGNVRELENALEYAVNMSDKTYIDIDSLPIKIKNFSSFSCCSNHLYSENIYTIDELERNEIKKAIKIYGFSTNSVNIICKKLGISRATFYRKVKKYNIISNQILIND